MYDTMKELMESIPVAVALLDDLWNVLEEMFLQSMFLQSIGE